MAWLLLIMLWLLLIVSTFAGICIGAIIGRRAGHPPLSIFTVGLVMLALPICGIFLGGLAGFAHYDATIGSNLETGQEKLGFWEYWIPVSLILFPVALVAYLLQLGIARMWNKPDG